MSLHRSINAALAVGATAAVVAALPSVLHGPAASKYDQRFEQLEARIDELESKNRDLSARIFHVESMDATVTDAISKVLPSEARWISLRPGTAEQWDFDVGGRVQLQVLEPAEGGPRFHLTSTAMDGDLQLRAGQTLRAIDDLGTTRRIFDTTLHRLRTDRTGRPADALVSVVVSIDQG